MLRSADFEASPRNNKKRIEGFPARCAPHQESREMNVGKPKKITIVVPKEHPVPSKLPPMPNPAPVLVP